MMDVLLKAGADPNAQDEDGMTALRHVAWTGKNQVNAAKCLIAAKADVNLAADDAWTPLIQTMYDDPSDMCSRQTPVIGRGPNFPRD